MLQNLISTFASAISSFQNILTIQSSFLASSESSIDGASTKCQGEVLDVMSFVRQISKDWALLVHSMKEKVLLSSTLPTLKLRPMP
jgi:hypothetical protein